MQPLLYHLRIACRSLNQARGFATTTLVTLTMALSFFVTSISVFDSFVMSPLPYPDEDNLVAIKQRTLIDGKEESNFQTVRGYLSWYERQHSIELFSVAATANDLVLSFSDKPKLGISYVTPRFFELLGASFVIGGPFSEREDIGELSRHAIISEDLWNERYKKSNDVLGESIKVGTESYTIIGVVSGEYKEPFFLNGGNNQIWLPFDSSSLYNAKWDSTYSNIIALGRLEKSNFDTSAIELTELMEDIKPEWSSAWPDLKKITPYYQTVRELEFGESTKLSAVVLLGVFILLCIAAVNVSTLVMARTIKQAGNMKIRLLVGATKNQLVLSQLSEIIVLILASIILSIIFTYPLVSAIEEIFAGSISSNLELFVSWRVWLYAVAIVFALMFFFSCIVRASYSFDSISTRQGTGKGVNGSLPRYWVRVFMGLSFFLIVSIASLGSSVLVSSLSSLTRDMNWDETNVLHYFTFSSNSDLTIGEKEILYDNLRSTLLEHEAIKAVGMGSPPLSRKVIAMSLRVANGESLGFVRTSKAHTDYFSLFKIDVIEGNEFSQRGLRGDINEAIVTQSLAEKIGSQSLGKNIFINDKPHIVVGITEDINDPNTFEENGSVRLWVPQQPSYFPINIKLKKGSQLSQDALMRILMSVDSSLMIWDSYGVEKLVDKSLFTNYLTLAISGGIAFFGVTLSLIGIWGIVGYLLEIQKVNLAIYRALGMTKTQFFIWLSKEFGIVISIAIIMSGIVCFTVKLYFDNSWLNFTSLLPISFAISSIISAVFVTIILILKGKEIIGSRISSLLLR